MLGVYDTVDQAVKYLVKYNFDGHILYEWNVNSMVPTRSFRVHIEHPKILHDLHQRRYYKTRNGIFNSKIRDLDDFQIHIELANDYTKTVNDWYRKLKLFNKSDQSTFEITNPFPS